MAASIDELKVADAAAAWSALGFAVEGDACALGDVRVRLVGPDAGKGLVGWSLRGFGGGELDGLPTSGSDQGPPGEAPPHPNGISILDHVVAFTPALDRTVAALRGAGLDLRRIREEPTPAGAPRQAFFRLGSAILEVVQQPAEMVEDADRPAFFWGLALVAPDLEASVAALGDAAGEPRDAVQPGRRISTLRRSAGLSVPIALMSPREAKAG